jgi:membrane protein implicated in regulation of membrane protease activity
LLLCAVVVVVVFVVVVVVVSPFFLFRWRPRNDCEQSKVNHPSKQTKGIRPISLFLV